jgi:hypothetical protein
MLKKALIPILLILGVVLLLAGGMYFYEKKWGLEGTWPGED